MTVYSECAVCEFVLQAESDVDPAPKHWDACPDCGATDFEFSTGELPTP